MFIYATYDDEKGSQLDKIQRMFGTSPHLIRIGFTREVEKVRSNLATAVILSFTCHYCHIVPRLRSLVSNVPSCFPSRIPAFSTCKQSWKKRKPTVLYVLNMNSTCNAEPLLAKADVIG